MSRSRRTPKRYRRYVDKPKSFGDEVRKKHKSVSRQRMRECRYDDFPPAPNRAWVKWYS